MKWYRYVLRYGILYVGTFSDNYTQNFSAPGWSMRFWCQLREFENKTILQGYILKKVPSPTSGEGTYWLIVFGGGGVCGERILSGECTTGEDLKEKGERG
jgi:hypothetical protein